MAYYGYGGWAFRPYVPVAQRRAQAARELAKLARKTGRAAEPVVIEGGRRAIATTFWGKAWCDNLERYGDYANRLPRGRSYVRNGSVVDLAIAPGEIHARVAGSDLYTVRIDIARMAKARWRAVVTRCTGRIGSLVGLLRGELSAEVLAMLCEARHGIFPEPREITMNCSCPDWAGVCKHVAAVLYGIGARLDRRPELFFTLRQVDQAELIGAATKGAVARGGTTGAKRIADDKLAEVFGIELAEDVAALAPRPAPLRRPRRKAPAASTARKPKARPARTPRRRSR